MKLALNALVKYACGIVMVGLLIFLPAGTLAWTRGWLMMGLLFIPMMLLGIVLYLKAPDLLRKRLNNREKMDSQKRTVAGAALVFIAGFVAAGLDARFAWSKVDAGLGACAALLFLLSYGMYAEVMRENAFLSRTIEVQEGQKVVDSGLYGIVRHPMYAASVMMFLSIPLVLGSWISLVVFAAYPILIAGRIRNEERLLAEELTGYEAYMQKVKYRLIPFVW